MDKKDQHKYTTLKTINSLAMQKKILKVVITQKMLNKQNRIILFPKLNQTQYKFRNRAIAAN